MIKAKYNDLLACQTNLDSLIKMDLNPIVTVALSRVVKAMQVEFRAFEEARIALCQKYGEIQHIKDENGKELPNQGYDILPDKQEIFDNEIKSLLEKDIEMPVAQIDPADLYTYEDGEKVLLKTTSVFMFPLEFIFKSK